MDQKNDLIDSFELFEKQMNQDVVPQKQQFEEEKNSAPEKHEDAGRFTFNTNKHNDVDIDLNMIQKQMMDLQQKMGNSG